jgi:hypothetical protein
VSQELRRSTGLSKNGSQKLFAKLFDRIPAAAADPAGTAMEASDDIFQGRYQTIGMEPPKLPRDLNGVHHVRHPA